MKFLELPTLREWLEWRSKGIGSSDAPAVVNASKWMTKTELWAIKSGQMLPKSVGPAARAGLKLEPFARTRYEKMTGISMPKANVQHEKTSFLRASLDGINMQHRRILEIKCPQDSNDHETAKSGKIPPHYLWQCVHQLLVTGFKRLDYFSYDHRTNSGIIVQFESDPELEAELLSAEQEFWKCVLTKTVPVIASKKLDLSGLSFQEKLATVHRLKRSGK